MSAAVVFAAAGLLTVVQCWGASPALEAATCRGPSATEPGACAVPARAGPPAASGGPGLVLLQDRFVASIDAGKHQPAAGLTCAPFSEWPDVDNGVTCGGCTALVSTALHSRCDRYCASFGHVCVAAAEEKGESCAVKRIAACNQDIPGTSDMLCTCGLGSEGLVPRPPLASVCGSTRGCDYCGADERPMHAGCFIVRDNRLLAIRITYGGRKFDVPGGQTNWQEPGRCTAHRETYEETGYEVAPRELLAGGLHGGGFDLYRCELLKGTPSKSPDHEVSGLWWLTPDEVSAMAARGEWRFPEASSYRSWMR